MNRIVFTAAMLAASAAVAGEAEVDLVPYGYVSQLMRSVQSEAKAAQAAGKTGAQVSADTRETTKLGLVRRSEYAPAASTPEQDEKVRRDRLRALRESVTTY